MQIKCRKLQTVALVLVKDASIFLIIEMNGIAIANLRVANAKLQEKNLAALDASTTRAGHSLIDQVMISVVRLLVIASGSVHPS